MRRSAERSFTTLQLELPACQSVEEVCSDLEIQAETDFSVHSPPPHLSTPAPTRLSSGSQILLILVWPFSKQKPQNTLSQALTDLLTFPRLFACPKPRLSLLNDMPDAGFRPSSQSWWMRLAQCSSSFRLVPCPTRTRRGMTCFECPPADRLAYRTSPRTLFRQIVKSAWRKG